MARILVTRPEPGLSATLEKLRKGGHDAVGLPLFTITSRAIRPDQIPDGTDAILLSSANALETARLLRDQLPDAAFCVGARSAAGLRDIGFDIQACGKDAADLIALLADSSERPHVITYLCGTTRKPDLEAGLRNLGTTVTPLECYDAIARNWTNDDLGALAGAPFEAVLLYAPSAARRMAELMGNSLALTQATAGSRFLCLSDAIADALPAEMRRRVEISHHPDEETLFALIGNSV